MSQLIFRSMFHYYVALKLSAAAVGPLGAPWVYDAPAPIVRRYSRTDESRWDPLELLQVGSLQAILTVPTSAASSNAEAVFMLN